MLSRSGGALRKAICLSRERKLAYGEHTALSSPEIIKKIVEAEKESQQMLEMAKREISDLRRDTPGRIDSLRREILSEATRQREKELAEADRAAAQESERIAAETKRQVGLLSQISEDKRRQAVKRAVELLLS